MLESKGSRRRLKDQAALNKGTMEKTSSMKTFKKSGGLKKTGAAGFRVTTPPVGTNARLELMNRHFGF